MKRLVAILFVLLLIIPIFGQTARIEALKKQRQVLQEEIKSTNKLFLDVKKEANTVLQRINLINKQIGMRKEMISVQENEIHAIDNELSVLEAEIVALDKELGVKKENYDKAIQGMMKSRMTENKLFFVLSGKSFGESLRRMQYLKEYSAWQRSKADAIKDQNKLVADKKAALAATRTEKQNALQSLQNEQMNLQQEEKARKDEMASAQGKQKELQKVLRDKQNQADKLNKQVEKLIADEVARQERERIAREKAQAERERERRRKAAEAEAAAQKAKEREKEKEKKQSTASERSDNNNQTETAVTEAPKPRVAEDPDKDLNVASAESFRLSSNFAANKGKLPMPVTGTASIVGSFGVNQHREWNIQTNSNGIDIQAQRGASIRTVFDGEVSKVFSAAGSNMCVIVRHGEYYSFYANIYELYVKQGDKVKTGQSLGRIFTDPDTGISTMHFQLWQKTTKLNPAPWLKR